MKQFNISKSALIFILCIVCGISACKEDTEPTPEMVAAFSSDKTDVFTNNSIQFNDESTENPTSWNWTFEGGTPSTSTEQNPLITYNDEGTFSVSLEVSNASSTHTITKNDLIKVACGDRYCIPQFTSFTKTDRIAYGIEQEQHELIVYQPEGDTESKRATVLLFGGGGFQSPSNLDYLEPLAANLTKYGVVVAVARYRVNTQWPAQSRLIYAQQDSRTAVRFLKKEAATYGIDTNQIFAGGYSAGAYTALFHAYVDMNDLKLAEQIVIDQIGGIEGTSQGNAGYSSDVAGVVSLAGGLFLTLDPITAADVPIFAIHGTDDMDTPYDKDQTTFGSKPITEKVAQVGLKAELYTIDGGDHSSPRLKSDEYIKNLMAFIKEVIE